MSTPLFREAVRLIHLGYRNLELVDELMAKFDIGPSAERELEETVHALRKRIDDARACALEAATQLFRDEHSFAEVVEVLRAPGLLTSSEIIGFAVKARDAVKAEQSFDSPS